MVSNYSDRKNVERLWMMLREDSGRNTSWPILGNTKIKNSSSLSEFEPDKQRRAFVRSLRAATGSFLAVQTPQSHFGAEYIMLVACRDWKQGETRPLVTPRRRETAFPRTMRQNQVQRLYRSVPNFSSAIIIHHPQERLILWKKTPHAFQQPASFKQTTLNELRLEMRVQAGCFCGTHCLPRYKTKPDDVAFTHISHSAVPANHFSGSGNVICMGINFLTPAGPVFVSRSFDLFPKGWPQDIWNCYRHDR